VDPGLLGQVVMNLAVNARDAMPDGGRLSISTANVEVDQAFAQSHFNALPGPYVMLSVSDTGIGMDEATQARIFDPFFTTKELGKGTGLGLATVYGIVQQHQGWIEVESQIGQGTNFKVFLPIATKAEPKDRATKSGDVPGGDETILVVEDEPALRELIQEILQKKGYRVLEAATGPQALKLWDQHKDDIDLLLTDIMMPEGLSGRELAERVLQDRADLKVIYSSGYSLDVVGQEPPFMDGANFLQKPYDPDTIARMVRDCLNN
jgi:CheY-like chemotaxis protein